jgi:uncharacterized protein YkwD
MHFESLTKGVYSIIVSVGVAVSSTFLPPASPPSSPALQAPSVEAFNTPSENYNLEKPQPATEEAKERLVPADVAIVLAPDTTPEIEKEATASPVVTVEKPIVKKIVKPTPSPSASSNTKKSTEESKKVEEKTEEKEKVTPQTIVSKLSDGAEKLFSMVNEHRSKIGLPTFEKESRVCEMVSKRAPQVYDEVFKEGPMHKGFKALNLPFWATENIAAYDTIEKNFDFWLRDDIHRRAIESAAKYSCVACSGTYCSQIFTSFIPK